MPKKVKIELDFDLGDKVYLNTDPENERMVVGIILRPGGIAVYILVCGTEESEHFAIEITDVKPIT